ncbi:MAG: YjbQ family protein [Deltaproteobacteria bacterium]|nr:YjbQ family protein [Deltaproteobacteria bacterium]
MKVHTASHGFETKNQYEAHDLTGWIREKVKRSGVRDGVAVVSTGHTSGALVMNELDPGLRRDIGALLERLVPPRGDYGHQANAPSHLSALLLGGSQTIPVRGGEAHFGTYQSVYWVEAERRPRNRKVDLTVIGI